MIKRRRLIALALVTVGAMVGCGTTPSSGPKPPDDHGGHTTPPPDDYGGYTTPPPDPSGKDEPVTITFKLTEYSFDPKEVKVPLGSKVLLKVVNDGDRAHDFAITAYGVEGDILASGKSQELTFTADKAGEFEIVCSLKGHKEKGMVAKLIVK